MEICVSEVADARGPGHRGGWWHAVRVPNCAAWVVLTAATALMCWIAWWCGLREKPQPFDAAISAKFAERQGRLMAGGLQPELTAVAQSARPLEIGSTLPPLDAAGWLNGPPGEMTGKVVVVDVWDDHCSMCRTAAPDMLALYERFAPQGVVFVGLTSADEQDAAPFMSMTKLPWSNGVGAGSSIRSLVGSAPTVFVVGRDGRIAWHDGCARLEHRLSDFRIDLEQAIQAQLDRGKTEGSH